MTVKSILVLLPVIISGIFAVHLMWPDKEPKSILLKLPLGAGIGFGLNSLLYFFYLHLLSGQPGYFIVQILITLILTIFVFLREKNSTMLPKIIPPSFLQGVFLVAVGCMIILAAIIVVTVSTRKPQGAWDSWTMYNRTARFIFRGGSHWKDAFSSELAWYFHADYPPLIALNVASGWDVIGQETVRIPMTIGAAFLFASAGILFAGLNAYNTLGQAVLATSALFGVSGYIELGAKQISDIPLSFFILATGVLLYLYTINRRNGLLILAGLSAGLAAWTKNEGIVFAILSLVAIAITHYKSNLKKILSQYFIGFVIPIAFVAYFKIALAPPGDLFVDFSRQFLYILDFDRHHRLFQEFLAGLRTLGNWELLALYGIFFGVTIAKNSVSMLKACFVMIILQMVGYYCVFLITPHQLEWHLPALYRVLLQITPLIYFFYFSIVRPPESIFQPR